MLSKLKESRSKVYMLLNIMHVSSSGFFIMYILESGGSSSLKYRRISYFAGAFKQFTVRVEFLE